MNYIDENRTVFKLVFSPNNTGAMREKLVQCIDGLFRQVMSEKHGVDIDGTKLRLQTGYRAQGCIAVLEKWVRDDFSEPKELITKIAADPDMTVSSHISAGLA